MEYRYGCIRDISASPPTASKCRTHNMMRRLVSVVVVTAVKVAIEEVDKSFRAASQIDKT
jgi:hypothetical protein